MIHLIETVYRFLWGDLFVLPIAGGVGISLIVAFVIIIAISNPFKGLIYSQMALSIQLPVTVFTQVYLTSSEKVMGKFRNSTYTKYLLYTIGVIVTVLNLMLLWSCL